MEDRGYVNRELTKLTRATALYTLGTNAPTFTEKLYQRVEAVSHYYGSKASYRQHVLDKGCEPFRWGQRNAWDLSWNSIVERRGITTMPDGSRLTSVLSCRDFPFYFPSPFLPPLEYGVEETLHFYRGKAREKVIDFHGGLAAGVDIAESRKTLLMVGSRVKQLVSIVKNPLASTATAVRAIKQCHKYLTTGINESYHVAKRERRKLGTPWAPRDWWLEARFGWGPLYGSFDSALQTFASLQVERRSTQRVSSGTGSNPIVRKQTSTFLSSMPDMTTPGFQVEMVDTVTSTSAVMLWFDPRNRSSLRDILGEPLEIAWELVPFSFVVDRLAGIGGWLKRLTAGDVLDAITTEGFFAKVDCQRELRVLSFVPSAGEAVSGLGFCTFRGSFYQRQPLVDSFGGISFRARFNGAHVFDYLALLTQLSGKK